MRQLMKSSFYIGLALLLQLAACGGGDSSPTPSGGDSANTAPVAYAGIDQAVAVGGLVTLDGSGSTDANNDSLGYFWLLTAKPSGSNAALANADTANPTFTADLAGQYIASLTVNDGTVDSTADTVAIVAQTKYYVNLAQADDSGDGLSPATAKKTIMAAVAAASVPAMIQVATGTYNVTYPTDQVVLREGVSLYGGYSPDFASRDAAVYPATIQDVSTGVGSNYLAPARAVEAGSGITNATVIDGFTVLSGNTANSGECAAAIYVHSGGAPTISNNLIKGGTGERTNGIAVFHASPIIRGNNIYSGEAGVWAFGIYSLASIPSIQNNLITGGGTGTGSYGISFSGAAKIRNNTINGGTGGMYSTGIYIIAPAIDAVIENNIVFTTGGSFRVCLSEGNDTSPGAVRHNDLSGCPTALYADTVTSGTGNCPFSNGQICYQSIFDVNNAAITTQGAADTSVGNVSVDPVFVDLDGTDNNAGTVEDNDWHFITDGSSDCAVSRGGMDGAADTPPWGFSSDKDGAGRTPSWSIGAYEFDGACYSPNVTDIQASANATLLALTGEEMTFSPTTYSGYTVWTLGFALCLPANLYAYPTSPAAPPNNIYGCQNDATITLTPTVNTITFGYFIPELFVGVRTASAATGTDMGYVRFSNVFATVVAPLTTLPNGTQQIGPVTSASVSPTSVVLHSQDALVDGAANILLPLFQPDMETNLIDLFSVATDGMIATYPPFQP